MNAPSSHSSSGLIPHQQLPVMLGRYELLGALARGGMATVHLARHRGEAGFQRLFAIKVLHAHLADDEEFVTMLLDEARIAARLHHPNVVPIVDLGSQDGIHYVVMEYVEGCSLAALLKKSPNLRPPRLLLSIMLDVLAGLHAAHSLKDDDGNPMNLVHRDVSPQNVMVGVDGAARITDFGIARAESRIVSTRPGQLKGKLAFMSPEQLTAVGKLDQRSDVFSAGAMLWSALTARRLFLGQSDAATLSNVLHLKIPLPSTIGCKPPAPIDPVVLRALERDPRTRFQSAQQMEEALRDAALAAACLGSRREVAEWVASEFGQELLQRRQALKAAVSVASSSAASSGPHTPPRSSSPTSPSPMSPSELEQRRRPRWLFPVAAAAGLAVMIAGVHLVTRTQATPSAQAPADDPAEPATPIETAPPLITVTTADAIRPEELPSAAEPSPAARRGPRAAKRAEPVAPAAAPSPPSPPPPTVTAPQSASRWHKDAPGLPPE